MNQIKQHNYLFLALTSLLLFTRCEATIWAKKYSNKQIATQINKVFKILQNKEDPRIRPFAQMLEQHRKSLQAKMIYIQSLPPGTVLPSKELPPTVFIPPNKSKNTITKEMYLRVYEEQMRSFLFLPSTQAKFHNIARALNTLQELLLSYGQKDLQIHRYRLFLPKKHRLTKELKKLVNILKSADNNVESYTHKANTFAVLTELTM